MGTITKDDGKKNVSVMVRMPKNICNIIDTCVGNTHSSRPDFVIDGIRAFNRFICDCESDILKFIDEKKDADYSVKVEFYHESMKSMTQIYRDEVKNSAVRSDKDVDILLSLPRQLAAEIDMTVVRTGCFRSRQELIKSAAVYLSIRLGAVNESIKMMNVFLEGNQSTIEMKKELERIRESMKKE